jgi:stage II sporulation protein P
MRRRKRKKSFKTIVISRKFMLRCGIFFLLGLALSAGFFLLKPANNAITTFAGSDELYKSVIEKELPNEQERTEKGGAIKKVVQAILGFDPGDPKTILPGQSALFDAEDYAEETTIAEEQTPTPTPQAPQEPGKPIEEVKISKGMTVSNKTNYDVNAEAMAMQDLKFRIDKKGPQVLIVHTHTTESYTPNGQNEYTSSDSDRNTDPNKNIVQVGNAICDALNQAGIETIHDTTVHDYPSFNGAYGRSLSTVKKNLGEHPSIKVVLDVHRDGLVREDGTKLKVSTEIDGVKTAQVMFVVGSNASGLLHDNWKENMKFASKLQKKANELYPTLMRPINLREERFNEHTTLGSLIIEVGSNGNTLDEAVQGGTRIADVIAKVLKEQ